MEIMVLALEQNGEDRDCNVVSRRWLGTKKGGWRGDARGNEDGTGGAWSATCLRDGIIAVKHQCS